MKWINAFNKTLLDDSTSFSLSYLFHRFDEQHKGGFNFKEFVNMNEYVHLGFERKDLEKVFKCINKQTVQDGSLPQVRIQQVRLILEMNHTKNDGQNMTKIE
jgi:Ca2+-binding EF-hand superfamily protein